MLDAERVCVYFQNENIREDGYNSKIVIKVNGLFS